MKYVIWDWNGTLIDDVDVACACVNDSLKKRGLPLIDKNRYYACMEMPIIRFYERLFDLDREPFSVFATEYDEGYRSRAAEMSLFPDARETLARFAAAGYRQEIVSSAHTEGILRDLDRFGIRCWFAEVTGADNLRAEGKIGFARRHFSECGIRGEDALIIGDTLHDADLARTLNAHCVLVARGHQSREDLEKSGFPVADCLAEIAPEEYFL